MSKVLAKVKDYAITEEMLNETVEALRTQQNINITSEEQKQDLLDELIARQLVVEDAIESGLTQTEEFQKLYREFVFQHSIGQMFKTINVTDEECEAYYNENKEQFKEELIDIRAKQMYLTDKAKDRFSPYWTSLIKRNPTAKTRRYASVLTDIKERLLDKKDQ